MRLKKDNNNINITFNLKFTIEIEKLAWVYCCWGIFTIEINKQQQHQPIVLSRFNTGSYKGFQHVSVSIVISLAHLTFDAHDIRILSFKTNIYTVILAENTVRVTAAI